MKHLAILIQQFFDMVLHSEKTIESRWSMNKIAPFKKVNIGNESVLDEILAKGAAKAEVTANETLNRATKALGLN